MGAPVVAGAQVDRDVIPDGYQDKVRKAASGSINDAIEVMKSARPDLNHLREGGSEQEADLILGLMNFAADLRVEATAVQATTDHYEIGVLKNRYGPTGKWAELSYSGASGRIADVGVTESSADVLSRLKRLINIARSRATDLHSMSVPTHPFSRVAPLARVPWRHRTAVSPRSDPYVMDRVPPRAQRGAVVPLLTPSHARTHSRHTPQLPTPLLLHSTNPRRQQILDPQQHLGIDPRHRIHLPHREPLEQPPRREPARRPRLQHIRRQ